ncbi:pogo transposable element with krab domain-like [Colletotrichum tofieldiae]|nr:pogo transposable element with krab domain-like [Colletotrichum tofieldiae]GKT56743.1 pogo transposable element with krab domain-like [Colletotrichum tofieldiae]GKT57180.1 pogo transposable element with krab domain-like [Colletotrichum tofieldiae]GKT58539.1 pogo transposable element with krab domain-like [Colletotrichum tofieldiae]GKT59359.1 pogo transposable element with krab domain-like [Colletotrichum tofieldiae]
MPNRQPLGEIDPNSLQISLPKKKPRGKKPIPITKRSYTIPIQIQQQQRSYSQRKRVDVVMYLKHHRYPIEPWPATRQRAGDTPLDPANGLRRPTFDEAADYFKIPRTTVIRWYNQRDTIVNPSTRPSQPNWPEVEAELYTQFCQQRDEAKIVTTSWFRRTARALFHNKYPTATTLRFSAGWFCGFQCRWNLSHRRLTKQATQLPADYLRIVTSFLHFIRRVSQPALARQPVGGLRFPLDRIINFDETPIPFEYLDGSTWAVKGSRTVAGKSDRSGWSKRQATLILYIFADGVQRLLPKLIFHGKPTNQSGQIEAKEGTFYSNEITVEYNDTAYNNEYLLEKWLINEFFPLTAWQEYLLVMDVATFHKTPAIIDQLRSHHITPGLIPPGTTALLQPLDTAINKPFKQWLAEATDDYVYNAEQLARAAGQPIPLVWSTSMKRIMVTHTVATAARCLAKKAEMVRQSFLQCGISCQPDGSDISKIKIKDIPIETISWDGWDTFDYDKYVKQEMLSDPEILDVHAAGDNTEYICTAEDVQRHTRPWDL